MHFDTLSQGQPPRGEHKYNAAISSRFSLFRKLLGVLLNLAGHLKCSKSKSQPVHASNLKTVFGNPGNAFHRAESKSFCSRCQSGKAHGLADTSGRRVDGAIIPRGGALRDVDFGSDCVSRWNRKCNLVVHG